MGNYVKINELNNLQNEFDKIKVVLGNKVAECRQLAGFPKRTYQHSAKSGNILFKTESGQHFPNLDTLEFYIELYQVDEKNKNLLYSLHSEGKKIKRQIIRMKRGWE